MPSLMNVSEFVTVFMNCTVKPRLLIMCEELAAAATQQQSHKQTMLQCLSAALQLLSLFFLYHMIRHYL